MQRSNPNSFGGGMRQKSCRRFWLTATFSVSATLLLAATPSLGAHLLQGAPGILLIPPDEVLREHTLIASDGALVFKDASGAWIRLITSIDDPEITNGGDGEFHPADPEVVLEALEAIPIELLASLEYSIYLLPYPRSGLVSSSMDSRAIYLTPGVVPYQKSEALHQMVTHEVGHAVHQRFLPDHDQSGWATYASLRGFAHDDRYHADAPHAFRPHEIFAEDFRVLFGGESARGDGSVENRELKPPEGVPGLRQFFRQLVAEAPEFASASLGPGGLPLWRVYPNPIQPGTRIRLLAPQSIDPGDPGLRLALFDVNGRAVTEERLVREEPEVWSTQITRDGSRGAALRNGVYWARVLDRNGRPLGALPALRILH